MTAPIIRGFFYLLLILVLTASAYANVAYDTRIITPLKCGTEQSTDVLRENADCMIPVVVKNTGSENCYDCKVELGIYQRETVNGWYVGTGFKPFAVTSPYNAAIQEVENCNPAELNVDTIKTSLAPGESVTVWFNIRTPAVNSDSQSYGLHVQAFRKCWGQAIADGTYSVGVMDWDVMPVTVKDCTWCGTPTYNCGDHYVNGQETDIDCGGDQCVPCSILAKCNIDRDCQPPLKCIYDTALKVNKCRTGIEQVDPPIPSTCGNGKLDVGEDCKTCPRDVISSGQSCDTPFPGVEVGTNYGLYALIALIVIVGFFVVKRYL